MQCIAVPVKPRLSAPWVATLVCVLGGMLLGYVAGVGVVLHRAKNQLERQALNILNSSDGASGEAVSVLVKIDSSSYASCSSEEIAFFRSLIFKSRFLKDAGHMYVRSIECSSMLGRLHEPMSVAEPDYTSAAGTHIFRTLPEPATGGAGIFGAQLGNAYVVFSPWVFSDQGITDAHFTVTVRDKNLSHSGFISGERPDLPVAVLTRDGVGSISGLLYATRCSRYFPTCTTAYDPIVRIVAQERPGELVDSGLGGLGGLVFCMLWSVRLQRNRSMEQQLRRAIKRDSFRMVYQPLVDIATSKVVGAEALIRWNDEEGTPVSPDVFIAMAEELGIIREITRLVVRHVLEDLGETLTRHPTFCLSINVSAADLLDAAFCSTLETSLRDAGVSTKSLAIEVTERSMANGAPIAEALRALRGAGFSVHLDDFGTGYSSLACLQELEIDAVKIDRAFIRAIGTGSVARGLLQQILGIAEYLSLEVILEGVETREQVDYFVATGKALVGQGWYFGRPGPAAEIKSALSSQDATPDEVAPGIEVKQLMSLSKLDLPVASGWRRCEDQGCD